MKNPHFLYITKLLKAIKNNMLNIFFLKLKILQQAFQAIKYRKIKITLING